MCQPADDNPLMQSQTWGVCKELQEPPANCGQVGQRCCLGGLYRANNSAGFLDTTYSLFCWADDVCECASKLLPASVGRCRLCVSNPSRLAQSLLRCP